MDARPAMQIESYLARCMLSLARANPGETKPAILSSVKWSSTSLRNPWEDPNAWHIFVIALAKNLLQLTELGTLVDRGSSMVCLSYR
jgi:hypothetical protein